MGATSLIPLFMSLALLSKTALDLTQWGEGRQGQERGRRRNQHKQKKVHKEFAAHQVLVLGINIVHFMSFKKFWGALTMESCNKLVIYIPSFA